MLMGWLERLSSRSVFGLGLSLVPVLGLLDYVTGPQVGFSVFYLLPVSLVAWRSSVERATVVAVSAALTWLAADLAGGQDYDHAWIPVWNIATRFAMFMIVLKLLANLRSAVDIQTRLATLDSLTNTLNPRAFAPAAERMIELSRQNELPFTVAYLDLDDFKSVNDRLGHSGGDEALRLVGKALRDQVRTTDVVARLGGDEFILVFPETGSSAASSIMDGLVERVREGLSRLSVTVTFSAGAVTFLSAPGSMDDVIETCDRLMYEAKRRGKDRCLHIVAGEGSADAVPDASRPRARRKTQVPGNHLLSPS